MVTTTRHGLHHPGKHRAGRREQNRLRRTTILFAAVMLGWLR